MRTINAPGVEIREIDKSQYAQTMVGTAVLAMGFANKGEDYTTMQMTSRNAWLQYYGEPDNEAERYFYNACMEVINNKGVLYCAKIPYENEARDKYVTKKYVMSTKLEEISSVQDYLNENPDIKDLLAGDFAKYGFGGTYTGISGNYRTAILNFESYYDILNRYNNQLNSKRVAVPTFWKYTISDQDDNWLYFNQPNVIARLTNLFDRESQFWLSVATDFNLSFGELNLSSFNTLIEDQQLATLESGSSYYKPDVYISAFMYAFAETFGSSDDISELTPWKFLYGYLDEQLENDESKLAFPKFLVDNKALFRKINQIFYRDTEDAASEKQYYFSADQIITDVSDYEGYKRIFTLTDIEPVECVPYFYWEKDNETDSTAEKCNLLAYYTAVKFYLDNSDVTDRAVVEALRGINYITDARDELHNELPGSYAGESSEFIAIDGYPFIDMRYFYADIADNGKMPWTYNISSDAEIDNAIADAAVAGTSVIELDQELLTRTINDSYKLLNSDVFNTINDYFKNGGLVNTTYVNDLIDFYTQNVNVSEFYDMSALYYSQPDKEISEPAYQPRTTDVFRYTYQVDMETYTDAQGNSYERPIQFPTEDGIVEQTSKVVQDDGTYVTVFEKYGNVVEMDEYQQRSFLSAMNILKAEFNKTITKSQLIKYINEIRELDEFKTYVLPKLELNVHENDMDKKFSQAEVEKVLLYSEIRTADDTLQDYFTIKSDNIVFTTALSAIDEYKTDEDVVPPNNIWIVDTTRAKYKRSADEFERECVGIVPVITTAANAMYIQSLIEEPLSGNAYASYQCLKDISTLKYNFVYNRKAHMHDQFIINGDANDSSYNCSTYLARDIYADNPDIETVSDEAAGYFNTIQFKDDGTVDRDNMYDIGVVVFRAYVDESEGNKVSMAAVESFVGSLDKNAIDANTGVTKFIDTIVNTNSEYINLFSNCYASTAVRKLYDEKCDLLVIEPQKAGSLGFYEDMCVEDISLSKSIYDGLAKIFDKNQDINEKDIDIVVDAGLSNIAQYIKTVFGNNKGAYNPSSTEAAMFKLKSRSNTLTWRDIIKKYDTFCKKTRKDCMFIADGLRPLCLQGERKIIRPSKPSNTIDANILPLIKYTTGINTNYGAGYCDWFQVADEFTGEYFWCPPSIKAAGIYINTDTNYEYWDAPAGLNRGIVDALDVAFSPTPAQAGAIYTNNWNYAINYPQDGIILEGQKTFQVKPSAFDRVNVRRLFLRLERATYKVARYFVYEGNTAYTRQRLIDALDPIFSNCKIGGGIYDYKIVCDETINTPNVIDNNELRVKIGIKPVKTAEFILIDFIALTTGGDFNEM